MILLSIRTKYIHSNFSKTENEWQSVHQYHIIFLSTLQEKRNRLPIILWNFFNAFFNTQPHVWNNVVYYISSKYCFIDISRTVEYWHLYIKWLYLELYQLSILRILWTRYKGGFIMIYTDDTKIVYPQNFDTCQIL